MHLNVMLKGKLVIFLSTSHSRHGESKSSPQQDGQDSVNNKAHVMVLLSEQHDIDRVVALQSYTGQSCFTTLDMDFSCWGSGGAG